MTDDDAQWDDKQEQLKADADEERRLERLVEKHRDDHTQDRFGDCAASCRACRIVNGEV